MIINQIAKHNIGIVYNKRDDKSLRKSFCGYAKEAPQRMIYSAGDAIKQWEVLKHPAYTDIFQPVEKVSLSQIKENKRIRNANYSFLDKLCSSYDKQKFIEYFVKVTGFPILTTMSEKILSEFKRVIATAASKMGFNYNDINFIGYDKYCSVGLKKALPGSDVDKSCVIIPASRSLYKSQKEVSDEFKSHIWNNLDNRLMSVNHYAAFPNVMTEKEVSDNIVKFDKVAQTFVDDYNTYNAYRAQRLYNSSLISGAKFNIFLSERLKTAQEKTDAKNFAYVIESLRDGARLKENPEALWTGIYTQMNNSIFCNCTNVTQARIVEDAYNYRTAEKPKIIARQQLERDFNSMSVDTKYDLVKDIIRSMSGDNKDPRFDKYFSAKADKQNLLLTDILTGEVSCAFEYTPNRGERTYLSLPGEMAGRYYDVDVYDNRL